MLHRNLPTHPVLCWININVRIHFRQAKATRTHTCFSQHPPLYSACLPAFSLSLPIFPTFMYRTYIFVHSQFYSAFLFLSFLYFRSFFRAFSEHQTRGMLNTLLLFTYEYCVENLTYFSFRPKQAA
jgi:hypothetical protein